MTNSETILELRGIQKRFGDIEALKGIDLSVHKGELFGFLGPNGAGKSTLMKIFSGFLKADAGQVFIKGKEVLANNNAARFRCGLVPQEIALYDTLSSMENLKVFGELYKLPRKVIKERSESLLKEVGLWDRRSERVKNFSGGMKRRLNIIVSLLHEPDVLLCDEPTVGVDPQSRNAIFEFLEQKNKQGLTIIYTTHYMEEAERLCQRIAIIDHGSLLANGSLDELLSGVEAKREILIRKGPGLDDFLGQAGSFGEILEEDQQYRLIPAPDARFSDIYRKLEESGVEYERLHIRMPSLESLFLQLTGHRLRD